MTKSFREADIVRDPAGQFASKPARGGAAGGFEMPDQAKQREEIALGAERALGRRILPKADRTALRAWLREEIADFQDAYPDLVEEAEAAGVDMGDLGRDFAAMRSDPEDVRLQFGDHGGYGGHHELSWRIAQAMEHRSASAELVREDRQPISEDEVRYAQREREEATRLIDDALESGAYTGRTPAEIAERAEGAVISSRWRRGMTFRHRRILDDMKEQA